MLFSFACSKESSKEKGTSQGRPTDDDSNIRAPIRLGVSATSPHAQYVDDRYPWRPKLSQPAYLFQQTLETYFYIDFILIF